MVWGITMHINTRTLALASWMIGLVYLPHSHAVEKKTPAAEFYTTTQFHFIQCKLVTQKVLLEIEVLKSNGKSAAASIQGCIDTGVLEGKTTFSAAQSALPNQSTREALGEYYGAWLTAIKGVFPMPNERKISYERRQNEIEAKLNETWNRFLAHSETATTNQSADQAKTAKSFNEVDKAALLESCSAIPNDKKRAKCFETVARMGSTAEKTEAPSTKSAAPKEQEAKPKDNTPYNLSDGVVKIGILTDMSGVYSQFGGRGAVIAAEMAVADFGGNLAGHPIEIVPADHLNKADVAVAKARSWFESGKVDMVTELLNSAVGIAVQKVATEYRRIAINTGSATTALTNAECSPYGIHYVYDTYALANSLGKAMTQNGDDSWFFLTADFAFGKNMESDITQSVLKHGGKPLGTATHRLSSPDFTSQLNQARASGAKVVALANAGSDFTIALKQAKAMDLAGSGQKMAGVLVYEHDVRDLGLHVVQGLQFVNGFAVDRDEETKAFSQRFFKQAGTLPTMTHAGVYSAVTQYLKAIEAKKTDDPDVIMAHLRSITINDMFAKGGTIRTDGRMVHDLYLMEVKTPAESSGAWDITKLKSTIPGSEAFMPLSASKCRLVR